VTGHAYGGLSIQPCSPVSCGLLLSGEGRGAQSKVHGYGEAAGADDGASGAELGAERSEGGAATAVARWPAKICAKPRAQLKFKGGNELQHAVVCGERVGLTVRRARQAVCEDSGPHVRIPRRETAEWFARKNAFLGAVVSGPLEGGRNLCDRHPYRLRRCRGVRDAVDTKNELGVGNGVGYPHRRAQVLEGGAINVAAWRFGERPGRAHKLREERGNLGAGAEQGVPKSVERILVRCSP